MICRREEMLSHTAHLTGERMPIGGGISGVKWGAMTMALSFGAWLKQRRRQLDFTQAALAARAHCSAESIKKIEAGDQRPSRELAALLADALAVPAHEREAFVRFARAKD